MAQRRKAKSELVRSGKLPKLKPQCLGTKHLKGCRPARPLCKEKRKIQKQRRPCYCDAYPFPHRSGSGDCGKPERKWAALEKAEQDRKRRDEIFARFAR